MKKYLEKEIREIMNEFVNKIIECLRENDVFEEEVNWTKVPVDTKVIISGNPPDTKYKRHFASYKNGKVYVFNYGHTSWSARKESDILPYDKQEVTLYRGE